MGEIAGGGLVGRTEGVQEVPLSLDGALCLQDAVELRGAAALVRVVEPNVLQMGLAHVGWSRGGQEPQSVVMLRGSNGMGVGFLATATAAGPVAVGNGLQHTLP